MYDIASIWAVLPAAPFGNVHGSVMTRKFSPCSNLLYRTQRMRVINNQYPTMWFAITGDISLHAITSESHTKSAISVVAPELRDRSNSLAVPSAKLIIPSNGDTLR